MAGWVQGYTGSTGNERRVPGDVFGLGLHFVRITCANIRVNVGPQMGIGTCATGAGFVVC